MGKISYSQYNSIFKSVNDYAEIKHRDKFIVMCHYPMLEWNKRLRGSWMLFGHEHGNINDWIEQHIPNKCLLDVGIDTNDYFPYSFDEIEAKFNQKINASVRN